MVIGFLKFLSELPEAGFELMDTESGLVLGSMLLLSPGLTAVENSAMLDPLTGSREEGMHIRASCISAF